MFHTVSSDGGNVSPSLRRYPNNGHFVRINYHSSRTGTDNHGHSIGTVNADCVRYSKLTVQYRHILISRQTLWEMRLIFKSSFIISTFYCIWL